MSASQLPTIPNPDLELVNGVPVVNSLKIAECFGKQHQHVLRDIKALQADLPGDFNASNFGLVEYLDAKGEKRPAFNLTRDGFTLLAMGFTGKQALAWKLRYIEAFNAMEGRLLAQQKLAITEARKEGIALGAKAALTLPPEKMKMLGKVSRYLAMGLSQREAAKLLDCHKDTVFKLVRTAKSMGLLEA